MKLKKYIRFVYNHLSFLFPRFFSFLRDDMKWIRYKSYIEFWNNLKLYNGLNKGDKFKIDILNTRVMTNEKYSSAGAILYHYTLQDLWAAKKIFQSKVKKHYDIGSRVDGFITHCLVFTEIVMLDIRSLNQNIENLSFYQTDAMNMNNIDNNSINSLSALHSIEHFGLGRYGDPIDPEGYKKALREIIRIVKKGGGICILVFL